MRVALNVEQLMFHPPGGTGRYTARLLTGLPELGLGDEVLPFCARHSVDEVASAYRASGLDPARLAPPIRLPLPRPILYEAWHRMNRPRLDRGSPILAGADLVHAPSPAIPPRGSKPLVATIHDVAFELHPEVFPRRGRRFHQMGLAAAVRRADLVITVSNSAADEITERAPALASRLRVVHNGVEHIEADPSEIASTVALLGLGQRPYVLWVGSLEPRKDVGTLISAFARMSQLSDDTGHDLVLVGPAGWLGGGQIDEADVSRLGERLHRVGEVGDAALRCLYAGADLFALPSRHEGFGLPVLEAMAQGTAVVCSDIPALREVTAGTARLVEPGDVESWVVALGSLLGDPLARDVLGRAGAERSREFTWERTLAATREVYLEALAG